MHILHPKLSFISHFALQCYFYCYVWQNPIARDKHMLVTCVPLWRASSKSIKTKNQLFSTLWRACLSPNSDSSQNLKSHPPHPSSKRKKKLKFSSFLFFVWPERSMKENKDRKGPKWSQNYEKRNSKPTVGKVLLSVGNQHASFAQHRRQQWCTWWTWTHSFSSNKALDLSSTPKS